MLTQLGGRGIETIPAFLQTFADNPFGEGGRVIF